MSDTTGDLDAPDEPNSGTFSVDSLAGQGTLPGFGATPRLVTLTEASRITGRARSTIRNWIAAGKITAHRASATEKGHWRIDVAELLALNEVRSKDRSTLGEKQPDTTYTRRESREQHPVSFGEQLTFSEAETAGKRPVTSPHRHLRVVPPYEGSSSPEAAPAGLAGLAGAGRSIAAKLRRQTVGRLKAVLRQLRDTF